MPQPARGPGVSPCGGSPFAPQLESSSFPPPKPGPAGAPRRPPTPPHGPDTRCRHPVCRRHANPATAASPGPRPPRPGLVAAAPRRTLPPPLHGIRGPRKDLSPLAYPPSAVAARLANRGRDRHPTPDYNHQPGSAVGALASFMLVLWNLMTPVTALHLGDQDHDLTASDYLKTRDSTRGTTCSSPQASHWHSPVHICPLGAVNAPNTSRKPVTDSLRQHHPPPVCRRLLLRTRDGQPFTDHRAIAEILAACARDGRGPSSDASDIAALAEGSAREIASLHADVSGT